MNEIDAKIFGYKITFIDYVGFLILFFSDLYCFWHYDIMLLFLLGLLIFIIILFAADRCLHTIYTLTYKEIIIKEGWFSKKKILPLVNIKNITTRPLVFQMGHVVVLTKTDETYISFQPKNRIKFIVAMQNRMNILICNRYEK